MKRLWIAALLLAALAAGSLCNAWCAQNLSDQLTEPLRHAQELAHQSDWEQAKTLTQNAYDHWERKHFYLHTVMRHSDTDQILLGFRTVLQYLDLREMDEYAAANADLITHLELLAEMEQATLVNVL